MKKRRNKQIRMLVILAAVTLEKLLLPDNVDGETIWPSVVTENSLHPFVKETSTRAKKKKKTGLHREI